MSQTKTMPQLNSFTRASFLAAGLLALASACGGQSLKNGGDDQPEAGSGGVSNRAGSSNSGGSMAKAGSSSRAGSSSSAGTGSSDDGCTSPPTTGNPSCLAAFHRWTHDPASGVCVPFMYGGCGATLNNYETLEACQQACPGGTPNYDACDAPSDCVLAANGCCGVCDGPSVGAYDFRAYNKLYGNEASACPNADVACGACPPFDGASTLKYFVPNCVNHECVVEDLRESAVTTCKSDQDCKMRSGTGCCESCGGTNEWLAVRNDGSFEELVCGGILPPCAACEAVPPSDARVNCNEGRCGIVYLLK